VIKHSKTEISVPTRQIFTYFLVYFIQLLVPGDDLVLGRNMLN